MARRSWEPSASSAICIAAWRRLPSTAPTRSSIPTWTAWTTWRPSPTDWAFDRKVVGTECIIGYLHRGVEKIAEHRTYAQFNPYVDRMDYVAAISNGLGYCLAVEKMLNVEAPPRAQCVRVILTELNRIASHLLWLGTHALDIGAITPVFYCLREREEALKIFEKYCGARLTTHAFRIGGLLYETYDGFEQDVTRAHV